jgi:predicted phosphodiesterase
VLGEISNTDVDCIVVGGDVVPGPMPRETLSCLLDLERPVHFIQGNGEVAVLAEMVGAATSHLPEEARGAVRWTAQELGPEDANLLATWPKTIRINIRELGKVLFCHATPRSDTELFTRLTPEDRLAAAFERVGASVVVCGHTHMQFDRMVGETRVVNAGSAGMPFGEPGAYWLLLGPGVQLQHTHYDLTSAAERIRRTSYPQAEDFAERNVLRPPSEKQMLEAFSRSELK